MLLILVLGATVLAAPSSSRTILIDETVRVPRAQFRALRIPLQQKPAVIECEFKVEQGPNVRAMVMAAEDVDRMRANKSYRILAASQGSQGGTLAYRVIRPGDYMVLIDNQGEGQPHSRVHVSIALAYGEHSSFTPVTLPPAQRVRIVVLSLAAFSLVAGLAGWRILQAVRRQPPFPSDFAV